MFPVVNETTTSAFNGKIFQRVFIEGLQQKLRRENKVARGEKLVLNWKSSGFEGKWANQVSIKSTGVGGKVARTSVSHA
jgi:hypothetical protein